jgi:hypothetical protein
MIRTHTAGISGWDNARCASAGGMVRVLSMSRLFSITGMGAAKTDFSEISQKNFGKNFANET